jgi:hypothetical protein
MGGCAREPWRCECRPGRFNVGGSHLLLGSVLNVKVARLKKARGVVNDLE